MRKRNVPILFRLNKKEAELLDKRVKRCGLTREAYLRHLVAGYAPKEAPPPDYYAMMRELYGIGRNLNQIAQKAHHATGAVAAKGKGSRVTKHERARKQAVTPLAAGGFVTSPTLALVGEDGDELRTSCVCVRRHGIG